MSSSESRPLGNKRGYTWRISEAVVYLYVPHLLKRVNIKSENYVSIHLRKSP
jgi:hypothetical protein